MAPESADALIGAYSETSGISAQQYARAVEDGYLYGSVGSRMKNIPRGSDFWGLPKSQRKLAYELGATVRAKKDAAREAEIEKQKAAAREKAKKSAIVIEADSELAERIKTSNKSKYTVIRDYLVEKFGGQNFTLSDGLTAIMDKRDAQHLAHLADDIKTAELSDLKNVVEKAEFSHEALRAKHDKFNAFQYYAATVKVGEEGYDILINVGRSKYDQKYHIYDITKNGRVAGQASPGLSRPGGYAMRNNSSTDSISQTEEKNNTFSENNSINRGSVRYINENKSRVDDWLKVNRLQLPLPNSQSNSATNSIPNSNVNVNSSSENNSEEASEESSEVISKTEKTTRKEGTVTVKADESTLSERQKVSVECLRSLAKAIGVNFVVEKLSTRTRMGRVGENGRFDRKTNTVYLDLNAGNDGEGVILYTASHELTHFIAKWSPKKYKILRETLFDFYGKTNKDVIAMAREQMAAAKEAGHPITFEAAIEEVVADAMERMLTDGNAQTFFETLEKKDKSLVEKIKDYFKDLLAKIRRAYEGAAFQSDEAQFLHESAEAVERIQALFFDALADAGETYREIGDSAVFEETGESFSLPKVESDEGKAVANFIDSVSRMIDQSKRSKRKLKIGKISSSHSRLIESLMKTVNSNFSAEGYELWIDGTGADHINRRHGENGQADHSMATREARELIPWVANNPDSGDFIRSENGKLQLSNRYFNADGSKAPQIRLEKKLSNDILYVSECVPDSVNKRVYITSAYIKKGSTNQLLNIDSNESPQPTPEASFDGSATTNSIPEITQKVNSNSENNSDSSYSIRKSNRSTLKEGKITVGMSDADRSEILKAKSIVAPIYEGQADALVLANKAKLESEQMGLVKRAITTIGKEFGLFDAEINIEDVDVTITLSKSNLKESVSKEVTPIQLAKLLPVLKESVGKSIGIECHDNRYYYDTETVCFQNLLGGYIDGDFFVPVRFGLKRGSNGNTTLYVVVDQNKISLKEINANKKTEVVKTTGLKNTTPTASHSVTYSISQIISFVNSKDLLRYIPDDMLSEEQKNGKWRAIAETIKYTNEKNDKKYFEFIRSGNVRAAQQMVQAAAKANGYTIKAYHGTSNPNFTVFKPSEDGALGKGIYFVESREYAEGYSLESEPYEVFLKVQNPHEVAYPGGISQEQLIAEGYDGVHHAGNGFWVVFDPSQIKSAKTIVYDNNDNIIPLSERFNDQKDDIRYSVRKSNRSTLTAALDSVVTDPEERRILDVYRANIENLDAQQERLHFMSLLTSNR